MERTRLDVYEKLPSGMEKYLAEHGWNFSKKLCEYAVSMFCHPFNETFYKRTGIRWVQPNTTCPFLF